MKGFLKRFAKMVFLSRQTDNPWFHQQLIQTVFRDVKETFPITRLYTANIPTYPSGLWTFTIGSKKYDPLEVEEKSFS